MKFIDLRSDTVTKPSDEMRHEIANAVVGDDVLGDDPTVIELQNYVAKLFKKEAALFVPSGTMSNQICLKAHSEPGWEILCDRQCHIVNYEVAGPVVHSGLLINMINTDKGMIPAKTIRELIRPLDVHSPLTKMVSLENTHNRHGGSILPQDEILKVREVCNEFELKFHLDGARVWNAHVATGISLAELVEPFDSVSVCLSKGLGAPIGSLALGTKEFINKCFRERKLFGGAMRQVGIIAAAGLFAVRNNISRLKEDHDNAKLLAKGLNKFDCFDIDLARVETNIVIAPIVGKETSETIYSKCQNLKIGSIPTAPKKIRFVTHLDLTRNDIEEMLDRLQTVLS